MTEQTTVLGDTKSASGVHCAAGAGFRTLVHCAGGCAVNVVQRGAVSAPLCTVQEETGVRIGGPRSGIRGFEGYRLPGPPSARGLLSSSVDQGRCPVHGFVALILGPALRGGGGQETRPALQGPPCSQATSVAPIPAAVQGKSGKSLLVTQLFQENSPTLR
jgi:hypothetical protein